MAWPTRRGLLAAALPAAGAVRAPAWGAPPNAFVRAFRNWAEEVRTPAASIVVTRGREVLAAEGWGTRRAEDRAPVWSLSKSITAACVASLADDGLLALDAPLGRYLPGLRPAAAAITPGQLIKHRSGLPGRTAFGPLTEAVARLLMVRPPERVGFDDLAPLMLDLVPDAPAGAGFRYSNLNYFFLGQLIEAVAKRRYAEVCNERLLRPAGIVGAGLDPRWGKLLWSTGGWSLSPSEYLAFAADFGSRGAARAFLTSPLPPPEPMADYTLGMIWQNGASGPLMLHNGSWFWHQPGALSPIDEDAGSQYRLWPEGVAMAATFDGLSLDSDGAGFAALSHAIGRVRGAPR